MKKINLLISFFLCVIVFSSCNKGPQPVEITKLTDYNDELVKFSIKYPENWITIKTVGERFIVFSSNDAKSRFAKYDAQGFPGVMIDVYSTKVTETKTIDTLIKKSQIFPPEYYKESAITIDGVQGKRFDYGFELEGGEFKGVFIIASKDNLTYTSLKIETFDGTWSKYEENINTIIASLKLAVTQEKKQDTITNVEELPLPSTNLVVKQGNGYSISIPDNFYLGKSPTKDAVSSNNYLGDRRADCNILIDVLDASKSSDFKKAATELASRYPGASSLSSTKLGGIDAFMISYKPTKDVKSRVYFAKKGDKMFRISIYWFTPEEKDYLPIFEKSISSIKFN